MPTDKQLFAGWRADRFLGISPSQQVGREHSADLSLEEQAAQAPTSSGPFTGEAIGTIAYTPQTQELEVTINPTINTDNYKI